ncbi:MAG: DNA-3-methyladenine glycosylase I [Candidatus Lokiarchaeota archaeon]|nr:DNA-3-methyladenine glycosylase I [Candidatus Lokiarchaeota archaeon]
MNKVVERCKWADYDDLMKEYHDKEWGTPQHEDKMLYELLILEGMQAGLSWNTILKKRVNFKNAFDDFDYEKIVKYSEKKVEELMQNEGIIRNRLKIQSIITNAKAFIKVQEEFGSFDNYIWGFVNYKQIQNSWKNLEELPSSTDLSNSISKDMKKRGFKFIGTTIIYAFLQAIGVVNDHTTNCFRYKVLLKSP